jgi:hypothetical protein
LFLFVSCDCAEGEWKREGFVGNDLGEITLWSMDFSVITIMPSNHLKCFYLLSKQKTI